MKLTLTLLAIAVLLTSCSSHYKKRQEMREKVSASTGLFCEFISGDQYTDLDIELNLQIAKKCDVEKNYTMTNYKNASDQIGVIYCCQILKKIAKATPVKQTPAAPPAVSSATSAATSTPAAPASSVSSPAPAPTPTSVPSLDALDE